MIRVVVVYIQTIDGNTLDFVLSRMKWYSFAQENTCVEVSCDICKIFNTVILKNIFIQTCYFSNKFKHYLKIYQKTSIFVCSAFQFTAENTFSFQIFLKKSVYVYHICFIRILCPCKRMLSSFLGTPILLQSLHVIPVVIFTNTTSLHILITHY